MKLADTVAEYKRLLHRYHLAAAEVERREKLLNHLVWVTGQHHPRVALREAEKQVRRNEKPAPVKRATASKRSARQPFGFRAPTQITSVVSTAFEQGKKR